MPPIQVPVEERTLYVPPDSSVVARPAWRFDRLRQLVQSQSANGSVAFSRLDDSYVITAWPFWRAMDKAYTTEAQRDVASMYPDLYDAYILFHQYGPTAWAIEAFITADVNYREIAMFLSIPVAVQEWYERLFYDVRASCRNPTYVATTLLKDIHTGGTPTTETLWKLVAKFSGLQTLLDMIGRGPLTEEGSAAMIQYARAELMRTVMAQTRNIKMHSDNGILIMQGAGVVVDAKQKIDSNGSSATIDIAGRTMLGLENGFQAADGAADNRTLPYSLAQLGTSDGTQS